MHKCFLPILFTIVACIAGYAQHALADDVVHTIEGRGFIKNWLIAGTFPSPEVDTNLPDGSGHLGFYKDYLESQGGEENGSLALGSTITYTNENGETVSVVPQQIVAANDGIVDLDALYGQPDNVMAYAFSNVYSDKAQEVTISLGSDDAIKVWLNGALVHSNYVGRGLSFGQDVFNVKLEKGNNPMLVKVVDMIRDWGFAIEVLDKQSAAEEKEIQRKKLAEIDSMIGEEKPLWPNGITNNPITYEEQDVMIYGSWHPDARLQISRAYRNVSNPTYYLYQPAPEKNTGVGVVILPGGGYNDVWIDNEGHEIALQFKEQGITSIVLKYRTNSTDSTGKRPYPNDVYLPAATADAKEAIRILRSQAQALNIDPNKIGVGGFSAGGHLSLSVLTNPDEPKGDTYPDFAYLIYPWLQEGFREETNNAQDLPPMFIVNGQDDTSTPADTCLQFYQILIKKKVPAELHLYAKGTHGFGRGLGRGHSVQQWTSSFEAWLKDIGMIQE